MKLAVLYQSFFSETGLENSREIGRFFHEFVPEDPVKATYQKPCFIHSALQGVFQNAQVLIGYTDFNYFTVLCLV